MTFKEITDDMIALYERKNHDYGNSFSETYSKLGVVSATTRMLDKMNRIVSLVTKEQQKVNDESLRDTLIDLANYAVMTIIELDRETPTNEKDGGGGKNRQRIFGMPY